MFLRYGNLDFELERVYRFDHRAVFDETGQDYLYTHVVIGVQCVFHQRATRSDRAVGRPLPAGGAGSPPPVSLRELRTLMLQPRQTLVVRMGREVILESPAVRPDRGRNYTTDAKGGPQPLHFGVVSVIGDGRTMVCVFEVETWINDFNDPTKSPCLLSNRWTVAHDIDELNYTTRVISGRAVFRKDFLEDHLVATVTGPAMPDDFRKRLSFPVPDNFKRESVHVSQSPDGTTFDYRVVDREQTLNLGRNNPILKLKGSVNSGYNNTSIMAICSRWFSVTFEAWGRRTSTRKSLIDAIGRAAAAFGFNDVVRSPTLYYRCDWVLDAVDKYARLTVSVMTSGAFDTVFTVLFRDHENILLNPREDIRGVATIADGQNPRPPADDGMRGTYLKRMVTQALSAPSTVPAVPPAEQASRDSRLYGTGGY